MQNKHIYFSLLLTTIFLLCFKSKSYSQCFSTILDEPFNSPIIVSANAAVINGNGGSARNTTFPISGPFFGWFNVLNGLTNADIYDRQVTG